MMNDERVIAEDVDPFSRRGHAAHDLSLEATPATPPNHHIAIGRFRYANCR
jgi:hypothetical protein